MAEELPEAERHPVYAYNPDLDEWEVIPWRDSVWLEDGRMVGDVSSNERYYNVIQYGEILEALGKATESNFDIEIRRGTVTVSSSGHRAVGEVDISGDLEIEPVEGDVMDPQIRFSAGHTGQHGIKYDLGAIRQICENGMRGFVKDMHLEQTHRKPLDYNLPRRLVTEVGDGVKEAEKKLVEAKDRYFKSLEECLLVLYDFDIHRYISNDDGIDLLRKGLEEEVDGERPTLYDTYNAATRVLTHESDGTPRHMVEDGLETAGDLIDYENYGVPEPEYLGKRAVQRRSSEIEESGEILFEGEQEAVSKLASEYGI
ncbi:hypothetical protein AKJ36_00030 [candidate division MSBL1 archaeon SCGC-AAA259I07]|uniref:DUF932 domain-containing protein n=1 Tax=candidate division MSBL1 archaeon SCGC-AAA259I07 TaxID=1698266 RepID=A0A133UN01_9EURY|nr:hypothetical protein AKJ36_00030 [candidate division MSBL1 archaeon SCGC-AAA259I07]